MFASRLSARNAARALLIPRAYPRTATPLWQPAPEIADAARGGAPATRTSPVILETYRECLRDVLDLAGLEAILRGLERARSRSSRSRPRRPRRSPPLCSSSTSPPTCTRETRRVLSAARLLCRSTANCCASLLGQEELRELIDGGALEQLESDLQRLSPERQATSRDELHDVLRALGGLTAAQVRDRVLATLDAASMVEELVRERRAVLVRIARAAHYIAAEDAGLYRRCAWGGAGRRACRPAFLEPVDGALRELAARHGRTHGPIHDGRAPRPLRRRSFERPAGAPKRPGSCCAASCVQPPIRSRASASPEWCDPEVLRRLRRASLAVHRREIEPAEAPLARGLSAIVAGRRPPSGRGRRNRGGCARRSWRSRGSRCRPISGSRPCFHGRVGAYSFSWLDQLCAAGEVVWVGAGRARASALAGSRSTSANDCAADRSAGAAIPCRGPERA